MPRTQSADVGCRQRIELIFAPRFFQCVPYATKAPAQFELPSASPLALTGRPWVPSHRVGCASAWPGYALPLPCPSERRQAPGRDPGPTIIGASDTAADACWSAKSPPVGFLFPRRSDNGALCEINAAKEPFANPGVLKALDCSERTFTDRKVPCVADHSAGPRRMLQQRTAS
jgi:hypothetical protein